MRFLSIEGRRDNPLGLDVKNPSFGWQLVASDDVFNVKQTRYHILVASSKELLDADKGDMWDADVASEQSQWIKYRGKELKPNTQYFWKVKVDYTIDNGQLTIDNSHRPQVQSKSSLSLGEGRGEASFSTGLFLESNWKGYWIGMDHANAWDVETEHSRLSARYFRTTFDTKKTIRRATLHICGLGLYEAYLDGNKIGDDVLTPAPTDYTKSVIYNTYDVTSLLKGEMQSSASKHPSASKPVSAPAPSRGRAGGGASSPHALAVCVSNGRFYTMQQNKKKHKITNFGYPCLKANLIIEYADGSS
ncbi:MAG: alpha-L-rhamnosidase N-terminal domain-containing protein, partial [Prevotella sp.]|nr:alpha-L-rhamnosidase N-terminal domain-containing protein [Prevotella sp.]